jgi:hypothetical protein
MNTLIKEYGGFLLGIMGATLAIALLTALSQNWKTISLVMTRNMTGAEITAYEDRAVGQTEDEAVTEPADPAEGEPAVSPDTPADGEPVANPDTPVGDGAVSEPSSDAQEETYDAD